MTPRTRSSGPPRTRNAAEGRTSPHPLVRRLQSAPRALGMILLAAWCALVFALSARPAPDVGIGFRPLRAWVHNLLHAPEYAVFAILFLWATARRGSPLASGPRRVAAAVLAVLLYAVSDEWHQSWTPGRDGSACDVLTDVAGGWTAAALLFALETAAPRERLVRVAALGVLACALAALIATFLPAMWPELGWL